MDNDYTPTPEEIDGMIAEYVDLGAIEFVGMDADGEAVYRITAKAMEIDPEFALAWAETAQAEVDAALLELVNEGLVEFEYPDTSLEPVFKLTEAGEALAKKITGGVDPDISDLL